MGTGGGGGNSFYGSQNHGDWQIQNGRAGQQARNSGKSLESKIFKTDQQAGNSGRVSMLKS
jgi:hypothetical protein